MDVTELVDSEEYLNVMFFGEPGAGKTTAAATMAHAGRVLFVDLESGLRGYPLKRLGIPIENISIVKLKTYEELVVLAAQVGARLAKEPGYYAGVIVDSATEFQDKLTDNLTLARFNKRTGAGMKDDEFEIDGDTRIRVNGQITRVFRMLRDLPCHTIFIALQKEDKESDGTIYYRPALGPKTASSVASYVNMVVHLSKEQGADGPVQIGRSSPIGKYRGKDNLGCLPERMLNPTFDRILQVARGDLTTDEVDADKVNEAEPA